MIASPPSLIFVLYDGINNSVFESQILQPLRKEIKKKKWYEIVLVSFESQSITKNIHAQKLPAQRGLEVIILKKIPFIGKISLLFAVHQLKKIIKKIPNATIIARGPLAGWICLKSISTMTQLTIQARGLLAAEYAYIHRNTKIIDKLFHNIRTWQFTKIEKDVYCNKKPHIIIEAVSPALKRYLIEKYRTSDKKITIARNDIPQLVPLHQRAHWRTIIRQQLQIKSDTHVYCYNGSLKPWQCPEKVIAFFQDRLQNNNTVFLLVLTQDTKQFEKLVSNKIPCSKHLVLSVPHQQIHHYLSACDTGIIFRESHILNWISRPTKILEYQAAGLEVIHNNTIAWLSKKIIK